MGACVSSKTHPHHPIEQFVFRHEKFFWNGASSSKVIPTAKKKSAEEANSILFSLRQVGLFQRLPEEALLDMCSAMGRAESGCSPKFYIVESGEFLYGDRTLSKGDWCGEETLEFCEEPTLLKRRGKKGSLWTLDRLTYQALLVKHYREEHSTKSSLLSNVPIFAPLSEDQKSHLVDALVSVDYKSGETIVKQGERGDTFFVVKEGTVAVVERCAIGKKERELKRRSAGWHFGEGALQSENGTRNADVRAVTDVSCLQLGREAFHDILGPLKDLLALNFMRRLLRNVPLLGPLSDKQLDLVCDSMVPIEFQSGDYICRQGDAGDMFYIIKEGQVRITESEEGEIAMKEVGALVAGEYFGEGSLLKDAPRRANVIAHGRVECFAITRDAFHDALGPVLHTLNKCFQQRKSTEKSDFELGDLQRIRKLGEGSFGSVYLVRHLVTGETYALKRIKKTTVVAKNQEQCVQNEVKVLRTVNSPFLVNLYATFKDVESVYMLTDVCLGGELFELMKSCARRRGEGGGSFPMEWVRFYSANIVLALGHLHGLGVVHRDVKPENVLLVANGYAKLADFGLAKEIGTKRTFSLCGTPAYVPPEMYRRSGTSFGCDWWALGIMMCEMGSGCSPFEADGNNAYECFKLIENYERRYPHVDFHPSFPDSLVAILLRLLNPNPGIRFGFRFTARHVKLQPFFGTVDWKRLEGMEEPAPYRPPISSAMDGGNFGLPTLASSKELDLEEAGLGKSTHDWDLVF